MKKLLDVQYDPGKFSDIGATETAENLSQWRPRKGDDGWPPGDQIIAGALSRWGALLRATLHMSNLGLDVQNTQALEVGAGYGDGLRPLFSAGFLPNNLTGVDLMEQRLAIARKRLPGVNFIHADAAELSNAFADDKSFDLVLEQFCFCHIPDRGVKRKIAAEMLRVVRPKGFILIHDWRLHAPFRGIHGVPQSYIRDLFCVGEKTDIVRIYPSHIWPPIGNLVSQYVPSLYPILLKVPPLVGSKITILRKRG